MRTLAFLFVVSLSSVASAALPPMYDSIKQFEAVLAADGLGEALGMGGSVDAITRLDDTLKFEVRSGRVMATVVLTAHAPDRLGPTSYEGTVESVSTLSE